MRGEPDLSIEDCVAQKGEPDAQKVWVEMQLWFVHEHQTVLETKAVYLAREKGDLSFTAAKLREVQLKSCTIKADCPLWTRTLYTQELEMWQYLAQ